MLRALQRRRWEAVFNSKSVATQILPQYLINSRTLFQDFESLTGWEKLAGNDPTLDTTNHKTGLASINLVSSGAISKMRRFGSWNLSAANGRISMWVYITTGSSVRLSFKTDNSNYYYKSTTGLVAGWNLIEYKAADWGLQEATPGTATWSNITIIEIWANSTTANISFDSIYIAINRYPAALMIFDDNYDDAYTNIFDFLKSRNTPATMFTVTDHVNKAGYLTNSQLLEMQSAGWTIANHTTDHTLLDTLSEADQETHISGAKTALDGWGLTGGLHMAAPSGNENADTETAKAALGILTDRGGYTPTTFQVENANPNLGYTSYYLVVGVVSLAQAKARLDLALSKAEVCTFFMHHCGTASPSRWEVQDTKDLIDYGISIGVPWITMDNLYDLRSGPVTVLKQ